jgi:hypothetical protein
MEIQIFRKIMEFILTLAVISPLFYARGRVSFKHGEESLHHLWQILCKYYIAKGSEEQKKKEMKNEKKLWWEENKSKEKKEDKEKNK